MNHEETSLATCHLSLLWKCSEEKYVKVSSQRADGRPRFLWGLQEKFDTQFVNGFQGFSRPSFRWACIKTFQPIVERAVWFVLFVPLCHGAAANLGHRVWAWQVYYKCAYWFRELYKCELLIAHHPTHLGKTCPTRKFPPTIQSHPSWIAVRDDCCTMDPTVQRL